MALKILLTNDDGINAIGMKILVEIVKNLGEIVVVAPKTEQSAKSHAIILRQDITVEEVDLFDDIRSYAVDSTPADCVRYALYGLNYDFDILLSGINNGFNVGCDIMYSGTVAATFEAASAGKKAIALSSCPNDFESVIKWFDEVKAFISKKELLKQWMLYNINFPKDPQGIKITTQGGINFTTYFVKGKTGVIQTGDPIFENDINKLYLDTSCIMNNYISITPLTYDRTNLQVFDKIKNK